MKAATARASPRDPELDPRFAAVYTAHVDYVWRSLRRLGVSPPELDDAVQETFLIAFRRWDDVRANVSWRAWLFGIARRVASHQRRGRGRRLRLVDAVRHASDDVADPNDEVALRHATHLMHHFLQTLPPRRREVFVLAEIDGLSGAEIAEALQLNVNAVWSRLRCARASFDRFLNVLRARERGAWDRAVLLREARRARMPARTSERAMAALAIRLGTETTTTAVVGVASGWLGTVRISIVLGAAMLALVTGVAHVVRRDPDASVPPIGAAPSSEAPARVMAATRRETSVAPTHEEPPHQASVAIPTPAVDPVRPTAREPPPPEPTRSRTRSQKPAEPAEPDEAASLRAELELLQQIRAATSAGRHEHALTLVERHRQRFGAGELARERDVQQLAALCSLGRDADARRRLDGFRRTHGSEPPALVLAACPNKTTQRSTPGQQQ